MTGQRARKVLALCLRAPGTVSSPRAKWMPPGFMVTEETRERTPAEVREYLSFLRRRINDLENTDPQRQINTLEATVRSLSVEIEDLKAIIHHQQQQIGQLQ